MKKHPSGAFFNDIRAKRKPLEDIWEGDTLGVAEIARFAPSACNTQPWFVRNHGNEIEVNRYKMPGKRGIMYCNDSFNGYNWCPCCWGSGIEGTGAPNYREYYPDPTD